MASLCSPVLGTESCAPKGCVSLCLLPALSPPLPGILDGWASPPFWECDVSSLAGAWMETLAAEMICGSLPASLPQFIACWEACFHAVAREKGALPGNLPCPALSLACLGFRRHLLMPVSVSLPRGLWGCCTFTLFPSLFQSCACSPWLSWARAV